MTNKSSESNLYQACILLFFSVLKFRRIYSNVTIHPAARGLSGYSRTLKFKLVRSGIVKKGQNNLNFMLLKALPK